MLSASDSTRVSATALVSFLENYLQYAILVQKWSGVTLSGPALVPPHFGSLEIPKVNPCVASVKHLPPGFPLPFTAPWPLAAPVLLHAITILACSRLTVIISAARTSKYLFAFIEYLFYKICGQLFSVAKVYQKKQES